MNVFTALGNLGGDAEVRYSANNTAICNFSLAVRTGYGDREATLWVRCALFGKRAEGKLVEYLVKGQRVMVSGELSESTFTDRGGNQRTTLELKVAEVALAGDKKPGQGAEANPRQAEGESKPAPEDFDDDVPF